MRGLLSVAFAAAVLASGASLVSAQIVYEPVQYQYSSGGTTYYYAGCDPRVHEVASWPTAGDRVSWGRGNGFSFRSGDVHTHREVADEPVRVYTDALPLRNATVFGFTPTDARNEAYGRQPTFFRKRDLVRSALPDPAGRGWIVPQCWHEYVPPGEVMIRTRDGDVRRSTPATRQARPILIIPKDLLDREMHTPAKPDVTKTAYAG
jgi:hypothetical protein